MCSKKNSVVYSVHVRVFSSMQSSFLRRVQMECRCEIPRALFLSGFSYKVFSPHNKRKIECQPRVWRKKYSRKVLKRGRRATMTMTTATMTLLSPQHLRLRRPRPRYRLCVWLSHRLALLRMPPLQFRIFLRLLVQSPNEEKASLWR